MDQMLSPDQLDNILAEEKAPTWMCGQNICALRDMPWQSVAADLNITLHLIREAYRMQILTYDHRGFWGLNSNFGDIMDWMRRRHDIMDVIKEASELSQKMDTDE